MVVTDLGATTAVDAQNWTNETYGSLASSQNGVFGSIANGGRGYLGNINYGAAGINANGNEGRLGTADYGAYGENNNGNYGFFGGSGDEDYGAYGEHSNGNYGYLGSHNHGVYAYSSLSSAVFAEGESGVIGLGELHGVKGVSSYIGVFGQHLSNDNVGYLGGVNYGVYGIHNDTQNRGYLGSEDYGAYGKNNNGNYGFFGGSGSENYGAYGEHNSSGNYGYLGSSSYGVYGYNNNAAQYAGYFAGNLKCTGTMYKGGGAFTIDHPLAPETKYLQHSFVESPDMKNIYDGVVALDKSGKAVVILPEWFEALNKDFRYQLTCIGGFANVYIAEKIENNRFRIAGGSPGLEVSWMVTGIRKDAYANQHRIEVEVVKEGEAAGRYLHPEAFGLPEEMGIGYEERQNMEQALTTENNHKK